MSGPAGLPSTPVVLVVGAGPGGAAAAIAAARDGREVLLVERTKQVGGTVASSLIHTIAGLFDRDGELINAGLPSELAERLLRLGSPTRKRRLFGLWNITVAPSAYREVVTEWLAELPRIRCLFQTEPRGFDLRGKCIRSAVLEGPHGRQRIKTSRVIDATGTAAIVRLIDAELVREPKCISANGVVIVVRGAAPDALRFPAGFHVMRHLAQTARQGRLPEEFERVAVDQGVDPGEVYIKLAVKPGSDGPWADPGMLSITLRAVNQSLRELSGFAGARVHGVGRLGTRSGPSARCRYPLSGEDVRCGNHFKDAVARCSWPMEVWRLDGSVQLEHALGGFFEIPLRSLQVLGLHNLYVTGKALDADPRAQSAVRVVGCCWATGEAAGHCGWSTPAQPFLKSKHVREPAHQGTAR